jgi:hypothetical protein
MGHVNTQITLKNLDDTKQVKKGNLPEHKVRQATVDVMVDTGATTLIINEKLFRQLGLDVMGEREITLANDAKEICKLTEPLEIHWEDRFVAMSALVVEDASEFCWAFFPLKAWT